MNYGPSSSVQVDGKKIKLQVAPFFVLVLYVLYVLYVSYVLYVLYVLYVFCVFVCLAPSLWGHRACNIHGAQN